MLYVSQDSMASTSEAGEDTEEERRRPKGQPVGRPEVGASYLRGSGERAR